MRRGVLVLLGLLVGSFIVAAPAMAERRVALVIGNAHYAHTPALRNPVNDAQDVAAELKQVGFDVTLVTDVDENTFARQIDDFGRRLEGADVALFYYAGHGMQVNDKNYLVATNAKLESEFLVPSEAIEVDAIIQLMESRARINLVFLDACRDNPLADNLRHTLMAEHRSVSLGRGLARVEPTGRDTLVAFSAAPGQEAEDGSGRNSPFAAALLRHMPEPGVEVSVMLKQVSAEVRQATDSAQRPQQLSDMAEPFYFVGARAVAAAKPAAAASDHAVELAFFQAAVAANDCTAIHSYLTRYPDGIFVDLARLAEQRLCGAPASAAASEDKAKTAVPPKSAAESQLVEAPAGSAASPQPANSIKPMASVPTALVLPPPDAAAPAEHAAPQSVEASPPAAAPPSTKRMASPPALAELPPAEASALVPSATETARRLQTELLRVGCAGPDMTANGNWDDESQAALAQFNRVAKTSFATPSETAIAAVHGHDGQVCQIVCGAGEQARGNTCIAEPEPHPHAKKEAERPRSKGHKSDERVSSRPRREPERERERETVRSRPELRPRPESASRDSSAPTLNAFQGSTSPISGPKGMKCHTLDEVGLAPHIVCF
jgi:uncharacterized caspase-like protein